MVSNHNTVPPQMLTTEAGRPPCDATGFHNNRDIVYDDMVLIFFMNTIAKPRVKRLCSYCSIRTSYIASTGNAVPAVSNFSTI